MMTTENKLEQAMELAEQIHEKNAISIQGGKKYSKVIHRIEALRRTFGTDIGIETNIDVLNGGYVSRALIKDKEGRIIATGFSYADKLAEKKSLEKLETTSVGRALANLGLGGDEYASLDEIESHQERYTPAPVNNDEFQDMLMKLDNVETVENLKEVWTDIYRQKDRMDELQFKNLENHKDVRKSELEAVKAAAE